MADEQLWLVRHGESVANLAQSAAEMAGLEVVENEHRDADVLLSPAGERQAAALGTFLASQKPPIAVWSSPYRRAAHTLELAIGDAGIELPIRVDERLRDRELGLLDLLTSRGADIRYPQETARRRWLGKFYHRPMGGESWADVALRIRSFLRDMNDESEELRRAATAGARSGGPILVAAHDAVIMVFLYVCLELSEQEVLDFADTHTIANASVTRLSRPSGTRQWRLDEFSHDKHLEILDTPRTRHSGNEDVRPG